RQPFHFPEPQAVRNAVKQQRMKTGIACNDLPGRACRRIAIEDNAYFFPGSVEHKTLLLLWVGIRLFYSTLDRIALRKPRRIFSSFFSTRARANILRMRCIRRLGSLGSRKPVE